MKEKPAGSGLAIMTGLTLLLLTGAVYVVGYYALSEPAFLQHEDGERFAVRNFEYELLASLYKPAAFVESRLTGKRCETRAFYLRGGDQSRSVSNPCIRLNCHRIMT